MKKLFLVLISLVLLPTLTYGLTDDQKYGLYCCGAVIAIGGVGGAVYYVHNSSSTPAPQELLDQPNKSEDTQNQQPQEGFVRHQKIYGQSEEQLAAQKRFQEFIACEHEALKKQEELKEEPAPEHNNKPTQSILSPTAPNQKPDLNNLAPLNKPIAGSDQKKTYFDRLNELGWD
jgi:hypothetical protein